MARRRIYNNTFKSVFSTKPVIGVTPRYTYYSTFELYDSEGNSLGVYKDGDELPPMYKIENEDKRKNSIQKNIQPLYTSYTVYSDTDANSTSEYDLNFNGYYYLKSSAVSDSNSKYISLYYISVDILRLINRGFYEHIYLPTEYEYLDGEFEKFLDVSDILHHIMYIKEGNGHYLLSSLEYITMLLNGKKIKGIEPDANKLVDIQNLITPKGYCPIQEELDFYTTIRSNNIIDYINAILFGQTRYFGEEDENLDEIYEDNSFNRYEDRENVFEEEIQLTESVLFTIQNLNEIFRTEPLFLTEEYNLPLFNLLRYGVNELPCDNFFRGSHAHLTQMVINYEIRELNGEEKEYIVLKDIFTDEEYDVSFEAISDTIYDLYYKDEELKTKILNSYKEYDLMMMLLYDKKRYPEGIDDIQELSTRTNCTSDFQMSDYAEAPRTRKIITKYGYIYVFNRATNKVGKTYYPISNKAAYNVKDRNVYQETKLSPKSVIRQLDLEEMGVCHGKHDDIIYLDVPYISETFDGIEISLLAYVIYTTSRRKTLKASFGYRTNLLLADIPWVKYGDRYFVHTTFTDLIIQDTVFEHLTYDYNVGRMFEGGANNKAIVSAFASKDEMQKYAEYLTKLHGELNILASEPE